MAAHEGAVVVLGLRVCLHLQNQFFMFNFGQSTADTSTNMMYGGSTWGGSGSARPEISFLFIFKIDFSHPIFVAFFEFMVSPQQITSTTGCPKKLTNRMLLEPWCTG